MYDRTQWFAVLAGAIGGAFAVAGMEALSVRTAFPLVAIPFATSIVTALGSPEAEPAQPRALIGGHLVATFIGLLIVKLFGPVPWAAALAVEKKPQLTLPGQNSDGSRTEPSGRGYFPGRWKWLPRRGPRRLARAERQRLLHLIPFYRDHRRVSSNLIALRCLHRGHLPQHGLPSVSERHRYAYGPGSVRPHTVA